MFKSLKTILLATDLTKKCKPAFEFAASLSTRYHSTLVLLHVFEKDPEYITARLKGLFSEEQWNEISQRQFQNAHDALIAKKSSSKLVREALNQFCLNEGIDDECGYQSKEIIVVEGELVEEIIKQIKKNEADLLVMGSREGFLTDNRIGQTIKSVMRSSHIPVTVVPGDRH